MTACWKRTTKYYSALLIAAFELIFIATILALFISYYSNSADHSFSYDSAGFALPLAGSAVAVLIILFMIFGVTCNKPLLMVPHLVAQIAGVTVITVFVSLTFLLIFVGRGTYKSFYVGSDFSTVYLTMAILSGLMTLAEIYFFFVVKNCYDRMRKEKIVNREEKQIRRVTNKYWNNYWSYWINNMNSIQCPQKAIEDKPSTKVEKKK